MFWSDPYLAYIKEFSKLLRRTLPAPKTGASVSENQEGRPCALLLSPHPDDECLTGALPLRLKQEAGWKIVNLAVTLGSNPDRKTARVDELSRACGALGFEAIQAVPDGFASVRKELREHERRIWEKMAQRVAEIITQYQPQAIFMPHACDHHYTHAGTHFLGMDALAMMPENFECYVFQTEYWHPHDRPNCLVGLTETDAALLLKALCCHEGENSRNAFHKRFPAYMIDNARRGSERIAGEGAKGLAFDFAMLYRFDRWESRGLVEDKPARLLLGTEEPVTGIF